MAQQQEQQYTQTTKFFTGSDACLITGTLTDPETGIATTPMVLQVNGGYSTTFDQTVICKCVKFPTGRKCNDEENLTNLSKILCSCSTLLVVSNMTERCETCDFLVPETNGCYNENCQHYKIKL